MAKSDLKDKTALLRQQHILEAAIRVFERQGYRGATIKSIAQEAGVADGTIYNVFANKEALLVGVLEALLRGPSNPQKPQLPTKADPATVLEYMISERWKQITPETLSMIRIIWSEALTDRALASRYVDSFIQPALAGLEPLFGQLSKAEGDAVSDLPIQQRAIVALFLGLTLMKLFGDPLLDSRMDDVPSILSQLLLGGFSGLRKSEEHIDEG